jgi:PAS domain S-box-containing protein
LNPHIDLQSLVETHEKPFVVIDRDFVVVAVNQAYLDAFAGDRDRVIGEKCHRVLHRQERPCFELGEECPFMHCHLTGEAGSGVHTHYDPEGRTRWVRINLFPLRSADGNTYVGELLSEIAARDDDEPDDSVRPVGISQPFLHTIEQLERAARTDVAVLVAGETGTGKELAAHFIHHHSRYRGKPFVALDCTVVTESLFESEVFGHERGAFTGSVAAKKGLIELADGGTLFLDEIGDATPTMQAKLLRFLETGQFRRVGGTRMLSANVRIICATNRDLQDNVRAGTFREDLYYRIACFCIDMPPLRGRVEDIPILADTILQRISRRTQRSFHLSRDGIERLCDYDYPGNVRELRNILQVAVAHNAQSASGMITRERLEPAMRMRAERGKPPASCATCTAHPRRAAGPAPARFPLGLPATEALGEGEGLAPAKPVANLAEVEARHLAQLLRHYRGNRRQVARALGISERTVYRKIERYKLGHLR